MANSITLPKHYYSWMWRYGGPAVLVCLGLLFASAGMYVAFLSVTLGNFFGLIGVILLGLLSWVFFYFGFSISKTGIYANLENMTIIEPDNTYTYLWKDIKEFNQESDGNGISNITIVLKTGEKISLNSLLKYNIGVWLDNKTSDELVPEFNAILQNRREAAGNNTSSMPAVAETSHIEYETEKAKQKPPVASTINFNSLKVQIVILIVIVVFSGLIYYISLTTNAVFPARNNLKSSTQNGFLMGSS